MVSISNFIFMHFQADFKAATMIDMVYRTHKSVSKIERAVCEINHRMFLQPAGWVCGRNHLVSYRLGLSESNCVRS